MPGFVDEFMGSYGSEVIKQLSSNLGINKKTAKQIVPEIAPLILGGLKRQMEDQGGPERVDHILNKYGSDSVLDNIAGLFSEKAKDESPDPGLGGLLGDSGVKATEMLAQQFKLDGNMAMKIIPMLSPLILGALTRKRDKEGAGTSGIASILDRDGDGSILDDVAGFIMQGLSSSAGRNIIGSLLGGLFGGGKRR